jgi:hypothetical protein
VGLAFRLRELNGHRVGVRMHEDERLECGRWPLREPEKGGGFVELGGVQFCRDGLGEGCHMEGGELDCSKVNGRNT